MTFLELLEAIQSLPPEKQSNEVFVFPPDGCPSANSVAVTELMVDVNFKRVLPSPLLLTGKRPIA
jgi:hypothetical protein